METKQRKPAIASQTAVSQAATGNTEQKLTAPRRDGVYMAKLVQQRGDQRPATVGRRATEEQREAFSAGYDQTNEHIAKASEGN